MKTIVKEPVRLRSKRLKNGSESLYLDVYVNGKREYEFLKLYLIPEKTKLDKARNMDTLRIAETIKTRRLLDIQEDRHNVTSSRKRETLFFEYYKEQMRNKEGNTLRLWESVLFHLDKYEDNKKIKLAEIDRKWIEKFIKYLEESGRVSSNSITDSYLPRITTCLNRAVRDGLISSNPMKQVEKPKMLETKREYLTIEELKILSNTEPPVGGECVKKAFLFSCLTGLRISDVRALTWSNVIHTDSGARIVFRQQKTKHQEYLDINNQALSIMDERGNDSDKVFTGISADSHVEKVLDLWVRSAGINKHITFHCARHTFAVMMITLDTDIYTVSKLLGHRNIATTQIYAKLVDKKKQEAVNKIPKIL